LLLDAPQLFAELLGDAFERELELLETEQLVALLAT